MIASTVEKDADITVGVVQVPVARAHEYGGDDRGRNTSASSVRRKPATPEPMPGRNDLALASMGIYVFSRGVLKSAYGGRSRATLRARLRQEHHSGHLSTGRVYAYPFET